METPATSTEPKDYQLLDDDYPNYDLSFKVIVIGNSGVGKSCLSVKATKNIFENNYLATVGFEFFSFNIIVIQFCLKNLKILSRKNISENFSSIFCFCVE